ncbi:MAG: hypothetical protein ABJB11_13670 [Ferruginibacter sp.]
MQSQHHHKSAARAKQYRGRSHTKKQRNQIASGLSSALKKQQKKKSKRAFTSNQNVVFTPYQHNEKPVQPCEKINRPNENNEPLKRYDIAPQPTKASSKIVGSKASPFGGGLEGATGTKPAFTSNPNTVFIHYQHNEKPIQPCEKISRPNQNNSPLNRYDTASQPTKPGSKIAGSKASPFGGGLEGAIGGPIS